MRLDADALAVLWIAAAFLGMAPPGDAASISGEVRFLGVTPSRSPIQVTKDQDYCGQTLPDERYLIGPGRGLENVVVYVEKPQGSPWPPHGKENVLDNSGCRFVPRVMAMMKGHRLVIENSDPKLHIAHSYQEQKTVFNLSLPFRGHRMEVTHRIKRPGLLQVNCDTHSWMRAYIHVFDHPFYALTDKSGTFRIADIPAGEYVLKAWHEEAGVLSREVSVGEKDEVRIQFEFTRK